MMEREILNPVPERTDLSPEKPESIADLFRAASRELASSDARLYRSLDRHLRRAKELLIQEDELTDSYLPQATPKLLIKGKHSYERQTRRSLQELCRDHGISGYSRMNKKAMIQQLLNKGIDAPQIPLEALTKAELIEALRDTMNQQRNVY
jgi:hypothetical protein